MNHNNKNIKECYNLYQDVDQMVLYHLLNLDFLHRYHQKKHIQDYSIYNKNKFINVTFILETF